MTIKQQISSKENPQNITLYVESIKLGYQTDFLKSVLVTIDDCNLNFLVKHTDCTHSSFLFFFSSLLIANILNYCISSVHPPFSD